MSKSKILRASDDFKRVLRNVVIATTGKVYSIMDFPDTITEVKTFLEREGYISSYEIATLVYLAYKGYRPLLLEGPPGSGKTFLVRAFANALGMPLYRIQCFEGLHFEDLVGHWNFQQQLLAIQSGEEKRDVYTLDFYVKGAMLKAMSEKSEKHNEVVLLLDEVDKADEEFEHYLLQYFDERELTIPIIGTITEQRKVYIFMTSNKIRDLTEPLLRRVFYLYIDYPSREVEFNIIKANVKDAPDLLVRQVVSLVNYMRKEMNLEKPPTPAEAIEFVRAMLQIHEYDVSKDTLDRLLTILIKKKQDLDSVRSDIDEIVQTMRSEEEEIPEEIGAPPKQKTRKRSKSKKTPF